MHSMARASQNLFSQRGGSRCSGLMPGAGMGTSSKQSSQVGGDRAASPVRAPDCLGIDRSPTRCCQAHKHSLQIDFPQDALILWLPVRSRTAPAACASAPVSLLTRALRFFISDVLLPLEMVPIPRLGF